MMKKILKSVLILGMVFRFTHAIAQKNDLRLQNINDGKITEKTYLDFKLIGVRTNINYGNANSNLKDYTKSILGALVGVSFQAGITPRLSLVPELYFMMKGGKLNAKNPLTNDERSLRFYTIELPILTRFHFGNCYVNTGPSIAYNLNGTRKIGDLSTNISFTNSSEAFRRLDIGFQMGGGYMVPIGQKRVALDVRYCYGLTNISYNKEMYNRSLIVSVQFSKPWKTNPLGRNKGS